ncbi:hypothetical protein HGM15179_012512, partial [Zosterops borbonicus]
VKKPFGGHWRGTALQLALLKGKGSNFDTTVLESEKKKKIKKRGWFSSNLMKCQSVNHSSFVLMNICFSLILNQ